MWKTYISALVSSRTPFSIQLLFCLNTKWFYFFGTPLGEKCQKSYSFSKIRWDKWPRIFFQNAARLTVSWTCILEWSNWPEILVTALVTPLSWAVHCVTVSPIDVANKIVNAIWASEDPLTAQKVIPTHCHGAQGHFGSHLTHLKWPIAV